MESNPDSTNAVSVKLLFTEHKPTAQRDPNAKAFFNALANTAIPWFVSEHLSAPKLALLFELH